MEALFSGDAIEVFEDLGGTQHRRLVALDVDRVVAGGHADPEGLANPAKVLISRPEDGYESLRIDDRDGRAGHRGPWHMTTPTARGGKGATA